ncbi:type II secretion system F family protein [Psychromicrobium xiongbiense]|uniref:type II secretion system F family protein n=1 Tax=Psychromicrobium xiongbiense TaxID=3051184 RepID=UPI00255730A9|nr:type II secretion system F family protein [Psychromicrobium sp. YIM S02556]
MTLLMVIALLVAAALLLTSAVPSAAIQAVAAPRSSDSPAENSAGVGVRDPAMLLELVACMLESGSPLPRCIRHLAGIAEPHCGEQLLVVAHGLDLGLEWDSAWQGALAHVDQGLSAAPGLTPGALNRPVTSPRSSSLRLLSQLEHALRSLALTGAPSASMLRAEVGRLRRQEHRELQRRAASLGVRLVLPMGLCALPAFFALGVIPVLLALLPRI